MYFFFLLLSFLRVHDYSEMMSDLTKFVSIPRVCRSQPVTLELAGESIELFRTAVCTKRDPYRWDVLWKWPRRGRSGRGVEAHILIYKV